jgi:hypothetical protein
MRQTLYGTVMVQIKEVHNISIIYREEPTSRKNCIIIDIIIIDKAINFQQ